MTKARTKTRMKRLAIGAAVVGAFVAGAVSMANRRKAKALLKKGTAKVKSSLRVAGAVTRSKVAATRERVAAVGAATSAKVKAVGAEIVA